MSLPLSAAGLIWLQGRRAEIQEEIDRCVKEQARLNKEAHEQIDWSAGDVLANLAREHAERVEGLKFALSVLQD